MPDEQLWNDLGTSIELDRMGSVETTGWGAAIEAMGELERGAVANPDEGRQVGHYWLRAPSLASEEQEEVIRAMDSVG